MLYAFAEVGNRRLYPMHGDLWICRQDRAAGVECKQYFSRGYLKVALVRIIAWQIERENADRLIGLATWGHNGECSSTREYSGRLTGFDPANVCTVKAVRVEH